MNPQQISCHIHYSPGTKAVMKASDINLSLGIQQQDQKALAFLYDKYGDVLYGIAHKIVHSEDLAQDIVQEAFIKIWKNGPNYDPKKGTIFTWALNITRNLAIDKTRSAAFKKRQHVLEIGTKIDNTTAFSVENRPEHIGLKSQVNELDPKYKEVIDLIYFRGYTQSEVKELLGIPLGTVKSRIRIGLRELRKVFSMYRVPILLIAANWTFFLG